MKKVLVLLSTYNGAYFLEEQLKSLYLQEGVDIHFLVRDDGSKDKTLEILKNCQSSKGKMTIIEGENIGVGPSFFVLINEAATKFNDYDYYAFCDQDDVWFCDKVILGVQTLEESHNELKMFYSDVTNTDVNLQELPVSCVHEVNSFGANLVANHILGCTMLFNGSLLKEINKINIIDFKIPNGMVPIHDAWTATVAYSLNADVIHVPQRTMYYRQHGHNEIGAGRGFWSVQKKRIKRYLLGSKHGKANRCIIALQVLGEAIPVNNRNLLELVAEYRNSFKAKFRLLSDRRMYEYGLIDNVGTFLLIMFNRF